VSRRGTNRDKNRSPGPTAGGLFCHDMPTIDKSSGFDRLIDVWAPITRIRPRVKVRSRRLAMIGQAPYYFEQTCFLTRTASGRDVQRRKFITLKSGR